MAKSVTTTRQSLDNIEYKFIKTRYIKNGNKWIDDKTTNNVHEAIKWYECGSRVEVVRLAMVSTLSRIPCHNGELLGDDVSITHEEKTVNVWSKQYEKTGACKAPTQQVINKYDDTNSKRDKTTSKDRYKKEIKSLKAHYQGEQLQDKIQRLDNYYSFLDGVKMGNSSHAQRNIF